MFIQKSCYSLGKKGEARWEEREAAWYMQMGELKEGDR